METNNSHVGFMAFSPETAEIAQKFWGAIKA